MKLMHPIVPLLQLLHLLRRVEGRKKLQKIVHVLQERGVPFPERFEYSYYGMYSAQLRHEVERLEDEKLVNERQARAGMNVCYSLEATAELGTLINELSGPADLPWADTARHLNTLSAQQLEGMSTILFLRECGLEGEALRKRLLKLKPHLGQIYESCLREVQALPDFRTACVAP